jgi:hypothetical protein
MLISSQTEFDSGCEIFVSAFIDKSTNLVLPREKVPNQKINAGPGSLEDTILITVKYLAQDDVSREIHCKMTKTMPFDKFIGMYSKRWDLDASAQRLTFIGKTVFPSDTPASVSYASCAVYLDRGMPYSEYLLAYPQIGAEHGAVLNIEEDSDFFAMDLTLG